MAGSTVDSLQALNSAAVLKFAKGGLLVADASATTPNEQTLVQADGTLDTTQLTGYRSAGLITTDGLTFSRSMTSTMVNSWQTLAAIRSDVTADALTIKIKFQETNGVTLALQDGKTLAAAALTGTGYAAKRDASGTQPQRRGILVAQDTTYGITLARILPNLKYSDQGDQVYGRNTELQYDATLACLYDSAYGSDSGLSINGPGWAALSGQTIAPAWTATTAYSTNSLVTAGAQTLKATTGGTSASTLPTVATVGGTTTDGSVTWTRTA